MSAFSTTIDGEMVIHKAKANIYNVFRVFGKANKGWAIYLSLQMNNEQRRQRRRRQRRRLITTQLTQLFTH